jgi:hypothetical protein
MHASGRGTLKLMPRISTAGTRGARINLKNLVFVQKMPIYRCEETLIVDRRMVEGSQEERVAEYRRDSS